MSYSTQHRLENTVSLKLRVDPKLVLTAQVLQFSQQELEQAIESELNENPALERLQDDLEPLTHESIMQKLAPSELRPSSEDFEYYRSIPRDSEERPDWVDVASGEESLVDHLVAQLLPRLRLDLWPVGEFLIGSLDERGYLDCAIEEVALECNCSLEDVEIALRALQSCEPAGVGATDLRECLLLQLRHVETLEQKLARAIVKHFFEELVSREIRPIMRRYRVLPEVVEAAFEEIRKLKPYPSEGFSVHSLSRKSCRIAQAEPDLILSRDETGWSVEVRGADPTSFAINRSYRKRQELLQNHAASAAGEKRHITQYVDRANKFIEAIRGRRETLSRIGRFLIEYQAGYIDTGEYRFLKPITRTIMAQNLGIHESTASRATMGKFVQIATGEVVPFEVFFKPALRVQKLIEEILATENPGRPMSDEMIAEMLARQGVIVARRTVNKYRDRTKLLSSRRRRSA